jgi:hypothetical protein
LLAEDGWLGEGELGHFDIPLDEIEGLPEDFDPEDEEQYDAVVDAALERTFEAHRRIVAELRISGASVKQENDEVVRKVVASHALPILARRYQRLEAELAARKSESRRWRAHDCFVQLAFDFRDAREADEAEAAARARVIELEEELRELGYGKHCSSEDEEEEGEGEEGGAAATGAAAAEAEGGSAGAGMDE